MKKLLPIILMFMVLFTAFPLTAYADKNAQKQNLRVCQLQR